eukprot:9491732-Lingulodinium_polyedra.AAC.1
MRPAHETHRNWAQRTAMELRCHETTVALPWDCHGLPWDCPGAAMGLPWNCAAMGLSWNCHGTAL